MAATIEVVPLLDNEPISLEAVEFHHRECLGDCRARRSLTDNRFTLRCVCGLEVQLDAEAAGQILKMAIGAEPHKIREHTISSTEEPVIFKVQGEV